MCRFLQGANKVVGFLSVPVKTKRGTEPHPQRQTQLIQQKTNPKPRQPPPPKKTNQTSSQTGQTQDKIKQTQHKDTTRTDVCFATRATARPQQAHPSFLPGLLEVESGRPAATSRGVTPSCRWSSAARRVLGEARRGSTAETTLLATARGLNLDMVENLVNEGVNPDIPKPSTKFILNWGCDITRATS